MSETNLVDIVFGLIKTHATLVKENRSLELYDYVRDYGIFSSIAFRSISEEREYYIVHTRDDYFIISKENIDLTRANQPIWRMAGSALNEVDFKNLVDMVTMYCRGRVIEYYYDQEEIDSTPD